MSEEMSSKDAHLYGVPRPKRASGKEISSSSTLAFTSELSSLISSSRGQHKPGAAPSVGRSRSAIKKDDIFTKHNRDSRKRALADLDNDDARAGPLAQRHATSSEHVDDATWKRARRRMEEKAR
ncbi:MAG: hypothetical protein INR71_16025, partial [Terriglobus roseus]|nr:hypothetical protein [Terriglobus roseus]